MKIVKLLDDRVAIKPEKPLGKTASGILIPDMAQEKPKKGKVLHVGKGPAHKPLIVRVGDTVMYGKYSGSVIENVDGVDVIVMRESDIICIIESVPNS